MRHCSLDLTMNVYTDPSLLDVAGALEALPDLSRTEVRTKKRNKPRYSGLFPSGVV
jgi:hypothetical protein